jgi:1,2-diacylglycerol-3-alpha-glucose alpha-1,2-galactosyltransferase
MSTIKVNLVAEKFIGTANGVYTAVLEAINGLKKAPEISLSINGSNKKCDVIHAHSMGPKSLWLSIRHSKKYIISAHVVPESFIGSLVLSKLWNPLMTKYILFMYNRAKMVVAVSPAVKKELVALGVKSEINVLCNSVDRNKFKEDTKQRAKFRKKYNIAENDFVAICVGQIQPRKGVTEFLETAKALPNVKFVWVGGRPFGRLTADFDKLTHEIENAPSNVIFAGIVDFQDMPGHYCMSDVYFLPSLQENFAFATIEASSVKLPLVLRDNAEYPSSLFTHYLKGKTPDEYAKIINKLATEKDHYQDWQTESDTLASKYEITEFIKKLVSHYKKVANK